MQCSTCGLQNTDGATRCASCGQVLAVPTGAVGPVPVQAKTSGLAITAFVLGLLCLTCVLWPLLGLPAIIFGIIALVQINKSGGRLKGSALAVAGIVIAAVLTLILPIFLSIMMPALTKARDMAKSTLCLNNMRQLAVAVQMYSEQNDSALPPTQNWSDALSENVLRNESGTIFHCPMDDQGAYAFNRALDGKRMSELTNPASVVLLFESNLGQNGSGGPDDVVFRHDKNGQPGCNIAFADGHTEFVTQDRIADLQWTPE